MPRVRWLTAVGVAAAIGLGSAQAQPFGHHPARGASSAGQQQVDCDMVAANPGSGMDKASCEAMNQAANSYYNAQHDPAASRPGDEAMSCDDIKAEFMQQPITAPSQQHEAAAQASASDYMAKQTQIEAQVLAHEQALSAAAMAASAASMANPIAGRAADQAVDAAAKATEAADNAQAHAELTPRARKMTSSTAAVVGDMSSQLDSNRRLGRLMELANEKHCHGW
jgi:PHD/YefM family antitoxin component YafN of YafNO toxin-antitoxin module